MRAWLGRVALVAAFGLGTAVGWWMVPAVAALYGGLRPRMARPAAWAGLAAALAWAAWLLADRVAGGESFGLLAARLGAILELPGAVLILITLAFPALLAWAAANLGLALAGGADPPPPSGDSP